MNIEKLEKLLRNNYKKETAYSLYKEKFMSLITDEFVDLNLSEYFSDYQNYAYSEIKKKLLRR